MGRRGSSATIIGRERELEQVDTAVASAAEDAFGLLLIGGDVGVGKSRLLAAALDAATQRGMLTLHGAGVDLVGGALPYGPIVDALRATRTTGADTAGDTEAADITETLRLLRRARGRRSATEAGDQDQVTTFERVLALLEALAIGRPLLLAVDDLQWADRSTFELLTFLVHGLRGQPVLLAATFRDTESDAQPALLRFLADAARLPGATRVDLAPLTPSAHAELVEAILSHPVEADTADRLFARTQGNPFYAEELLAGGEPQLDDIPLGLRDMLRGRFASLTDAGQRVGAIIAVARRIEHPALAQVAELPEPELLDALRDGVDRGIFTTDPATGRYTFRHILMAETVYRHLLPGQRADLHGRLADALAGAGKTDGAGSAQVAAEIAEHWLSAGRLEMAVPALVRAGRAAAAIAAQAEALGHFRRALAHWDALPDAEQRARAARSELLTWAAVAAEGSGELDEAVGYWQQAIAEAEAAESWEQVGSLRGQLASCHFLRGDHEASMRERLLALEAIPEGDSQVRAQLLAKLASGQMLAGRLGEARDAAEEAVAVAQRIGADAEEGRARNALGTTLMLVGQAGSGAEHLRRALAIAVRHNRIEDEALARSNLAEALRFNGRMPEAIDVLDAGMQRIQRAGLERTYGGTMTATAAYIEFLLGWWDSAAARCAASLDRRARGLAATWLHLVLAEIAIHRGELDRAAAELETADNQPGERVTGWDGPHEQRALLAIHRGQPTEALDEVEDALRLLAGGDLTTGQRSLLALGLRAAADVAEQARASGDADAELRAHAGAHALMARLRSIAARASVPDDPQLAADAALCAAESRRASGQPDSDAWSTAVDAWQPLARPLDLAYVRWRRAEARLQAGARQRVVRDAAADDLAAAWELTHELGAVPLRTRIEELAASARIRLGEPAPSAPAPQALPGDPRGLTARERQVLGLLVAGRTDREIADELFISEKTASVHVSNIKGKLAARSRVEIAATALRLGLERLDQPTTARDK